MVYVKVAPITGATFDSRVFIEINSAGEEEPIKTAHIDIHSTGGCETGVAIESGKVIIEDKYRDDLRICTHTLAPDTINTIEGTFENGSTVKKIRNNNFKHKHCGHRQPVPN